MLEGLVWLTLIVAAAQIDATVTPLSGAPVSGQLLKLDARGATIQVEDETQTFKSEDFRKIEFAPPAETAAKPIQVELTDGSLLRVEQYTVAGTSATLTLSEMQKLEVPTSAIRRVRLQDLGPDEQSNILWEELSTEDVGKDILVFRRGAGANLDSLDGVLHDITAENIQFSFEGEAMSPRRDRVVGVTYFHPNLKPEKDIVCTIVDSNGSSWRVASLELKDGALQWTTATDIRAEAPLADIRQLDYAAGNMVYLSDVEPELEKWEPFINFRVGPEALALGYAPRRDESFEGGPLMLADTSYSKGLALRSRTELVYRLGDDFRRFRAVVGLDDRVREADVPASVRLVISGDNKVLFDQRMAVGDAPVDLDLDLTGVRRLRILVDFGGDFDVGDYLNLCEARLTK